DWRRGCAEEVLAMEEGREPVDPERPPPTPEEEAEARLNIDIWRAIDTARHAQQIALDGDRPLSPEEIDAESNAVFAQRIADCWRIPAERQKWMSLPVRAPPLFVVRLPAREVRAPVPPPGGQDTCAIIFVRRQRPD
ncbi:MAG: hypothetical protein WEA77_01570, partial [Hyphomonas sp.]